MHTIVEEQRGSIAFQPFRILGSQNADQLVCCRAGRQTGEPSCSRQRKVILERSGVVDDCGSASDVHQLDGMSTILAPIF